jgi:hypothetical protein
VAADQYQFVLVINVSAKNAKTAKQFVEGIVECGRIRMEAAGRNNETGELVANYHLGRMTDVQEYSPTRMRDK